MTELKFKKVKTKSEMEISFRIRNLVFCDEQHIELKPRSRKAGVLHYLHALTTLNNQKNQVTKDEVQLATTDEKHQQLEKENRQSENFEQHCARLRRLAKPGALVYLITDGHTFRDEMHCQHALKHLGQISRHCELVVCLISDPLELTLPESALKLAVTLTDGINRQQLTLGDKKTAMQYQQQAFEQGEKMQLLLQSAGARVVNFSAGESLEQQLKYGMSL